MLLTQQSIEQWETGLFIAHTVCLTSSESLYNVNKDNKKQTNAN